MRQFVTFVAMILVFQNAYSFHDEKTVDRTKKLFTEFETSRSNEQRLQYLEKYKDSVHERLENFFIDTNVLTLADNNPLLLDYASLTDYESYINLINMQNITGETCKEAINSIQSKSLQSESKLGPDAKIAIKVVNALCK